MKLMPRVNKIALAVFSILAIQAGVAVGWASDAVGNRMVYTAEGVVRFVSDDVTAVELASLLFTQPGHNRGSTRSLFAKAKTPTEQMPNVTVAMLVAFEFDSAQLSQNAKNQLDAIGGMLNLDNLSDKKIIVEGHTDISGGEIYNLGLSVRRAESVKNYLMLKHNIDGSRLYISGKGESQLIDLESPRAAINRRVQFSARPSTK